MQKKIIAIAAVCAAIGIAAFYVLSASPAVPNEGQIKADFQSMLKGTTVVDKVEITKRLTEKDKKKDTVWLKISSHDEEASKIQYFVLEYTLYDEGGWQRSNAAQDKTDQWESFPLTGVASVVLVSGISVDIAGEMWDIADSIDSITIDRQDTNLEQKKDNILATINLKSDVLTAQGQMNLEYTFEEYAWFLTDYSLAQPFTSSYKPNTKLEVTEGDLLAAVVKKSMVFGKDKLEQVISFGEKEVLDFTLAGQGSQDKGTTQVFACTFKVDKKIAVFGVDARVIYKYDKANGWKVSEIRYSPKLLSVNIEGKWIGLFNDRGPVKLVLDISKVAADGSITAIFNFSPAPTKPSYPSGSYKMIGGVDFGNLRIILEGKEWIVRPKNFRFDKLDGFLSIEDSKIKSVRGMNFEVKK